MLEECENYLLKVGDRIKDCVRENLNVCSKWSAPAANKRNGRNLKLVLQRYVGTSNLEKAKCSNLCFLPRKKWICNLMFFKVVDSSVQLIRFGLYFIWDKLSGSLAGETSTWYDGCQTEMAFKDPPCFNLKLQYITILGVRAAISIFLLLQF